MLYQAALRRQYANGIESLFVDNHTLEPVTSIRNRNNNKYNNKFDLYENKPIALPTLPAISNRTITAAPKSIMPSAYPTRNTAPARPTPTGYAPRGAYGSAQPPMAQTGGAGPAPQAARPVYYHPATYGAGPLPFFLPPPGQRTFDPTLRTLPTTQAFYTTYGSRLRTGVTGLVQPEMVTGGPKEREQLLADLDREMAGGAGSASGTATPRESPAPFSSSRRAGAGPRQSGRGRAVNYAEAESDDDEDDEDDMSDIEEPPSDPDDTSYGQRYQRKRRDRSNIPDIGSSSRAVLSGYGMESQMSARALKLKKKRDEMEQGWTWLGDRTPGERVQAARRRPTRHQHIPEESLYLSRDAPEMLVPISIDLDVPNEDAEKQGIKIKDRFLYNIHEPFITPQHFAEIFCEDVGIPSSNATTVADLIQGQLDEAAAFALIDITDKDVTEEDVVWTDEEGETSENGARQASKEPAEEFSNHQDPDGDVDMVENIGDGPAADSSRRNSRSRSADEPRVEPEFRVDSPMQNEKSGANTPNQRTEKDKGQDGDQYEGEEGDNVEDEEGDEEEAENEEPVVERVWAEPDCRIFVNLDVQIYTHILRDRIEWDLASNLCPAAFAKHYCTELGLSGEAIPLVAHAITDELQKHKRDALELNLFKSTHPNEQSKWEKGTASGLRVNDRHGAKALVGVWRDIWEREEFSPVLVELSMEEMEKREVERNREQRRMMRTIGTKRRR